MNTPVRMHQGEVETSPELVLRLLRAQFPRWADLPIRRIHSYGTDNALYRLGDDLLVRLPRIDWAVGQVEKERKWLPRIAPHLPLHVPEPLELGYPGKGYPWTWGIYSYLPGRMPTLAEFSECPEFALQVAEFVLALRQLDHTGAPVGEQPERELDLLDERLPQALERSREILDADTLARIAEIWREAVALPGWAQQPVWVHGDLHSSNFLRNNERLTVVLDFSAFELNDPAIDLMIAWNSFGPEGRRLYRQAVQPDDHTWARGRARALAKAMFALPYYLNTNPEIVERARYTIREVLTHEE